MKKMGHLSSFHVPFLSYVLKLSKKMHFLQFFADLSKKSETIKTIYIYPSENSFYGLSKNGVVCYDMTYCFEDIRV